MTEVSHTKTSQRVIIWVIAFVMTGGFVGSYFLIILNNNNKQAEQQQQQDKAIAEQSAPKGEPDKTAFVVKHRVTKLQITDLKVGTGQAVKAGDTITVHYKGTLAATGNKFESTYDLGEPATFQLSGLIDGWQKGIPGMKVGGIRRLVIPASMAYGATPRSGIPADSDLVFEIELIKIGS